MEEEREDLTTQEMAQQAEVTVRTVQRWLKSGKLKAEVLPHGKYRVNPFDLVELSLPLTERAAATPKKRRLSYDELHDTMIHLTIELEALDMRLEETERKIVSLEKRRSSTVAPAAKKKRTTRGRSTTLPSDLVTWCSFARLHAIPERAVAKAIMEKQASKPCGSGCFNAPSKSDQKGHVPESSKVRETQDVLSRFLTKPCQDPGNSRVQLSLQ